MDRFLELATKFRISKLLIYWYMPACYLATVLAHSYQPNLRGQDLKIHLFALLVTAFTVLMLTILNWINAIDSGLKKKALLSPLGFLLIGALRGLFMFETGEILGLDSGLSISNRIMVSTSSTLFWLFLLGYFVNLHEDYKSRFRSLFLKTVLNRSSSNLNQDIQILLDQVQAGLRSIKLGNFGSLPSSQQLQGIAKEVKSQIDDLIRPISHRLWLSDSKEYPKTSFKSIVIDSLKHLKYSSWVAAALATLISSLTLTTAMPANEALTRILISLLFFLIFGRIFRLVREKMAVEGSWISMIELFSISYIPIWLSDNVLSQGFISLDQPITFTIYLVNPVIVLGLSMVNLIRGDQNFLFQSMESLASLGTSTFVDSRKAASYLHNSLQSELLAISKKLEKAATSPEDLNSRAVLEQLGALINRSISDDFTNFKTDSKERLNRVIENWNGILTIEVRNPEVLFQVSDKSEAAIQVVEELASNLVKHGTSETLIVSFSKKESVLFLEINPAYKVLKSKSEGLGSSFLNELLSNAAKYTDENGENYLRVAL